MMKVRYSETKRVENQKSREKFNEFANNRKNLLKVEMD